VFREEKPAADHDAIQDRRHTSRRTVDLQLTGGNRELQAAFLISEALSQHRRLEDLVDQTLHTALEVVNAENGSILLADPGSQQLVYYRSIGEKPIPPGSAIPWHQGIAGAVFKSGQQAVIVDTKKDDRQCGKIDKATGSVIRDMIILPLKRWQGESIGVIEILNKRNGQFDEVDVAVLTIISSLATPVIEEARLFEATKLAEVARLAGDMSHDIKNLLMPILCGAGLLKDELNELFARLPDRDSTRSVKSRELCDEALDMLQEDARRISERVREVADCVKGLSSPPQFAPCQVRGVVENVFRTLDLMAKEKGISLSSEGLDGLPTIEADERRLYNAFYNLVNNAIPEIPPGGSITIRGESDQKGGVLTLSVADTGRGMSPEVRDSLFTSRVISRKSGGTGLGTKIVKDVVDAHKGRITVKSEVGKGTTFHLTLPTHQAKT